eukprot:COSAG04_NODE_1190_length_7830_cov_2.663433_2_plen_277_part_00
MPADAAWQGARYSKALDLWGLGALISNLVTGRYPFLPPTASTLAKLKKESDMVAESVIFSSIKEYTENARTEGAAAALWGTRGKHKDLSDGVRSLIAGLLAPSPAERLGMPDKGGYAALREHKWFEGFDWAALRAGTMKAPWSVPPIRPIFHHKLRLSSPAPLRAGCRRRRIPRASSRRSLRPPRRPPAPARAPPRRRRSSPRQHSRRNPKPPLPRRRRNERSRRATIAAARPHGSSRGRCNTIASGADGGQARAADIRAPSAGGYGCSGGVLPST